MYSFGYDNWIRYGWGEHLQENYENSDVNVKLSLVNNKLESFPPLRAGLEAIKKITEQYPPPYNLMCSGGVDSQAMVWLWHISGVPFTVNTVKYVTDGILYNKDDLAHIYDFCNRYDIAPLIEHTLDVINFIESDEYPKMVRDYLCTSPQICTHMKFADLINDGTIIYSGNFLGFLSGLGSESVLYFPSWTLLGLQRFAKSLSKKKVIPFFFLHTPELAFAMTQKIRKISPLIKNVNDDFTINQDGSYFSKTKYLQNSGFPVIPQNTKMTGFEKIKDYYQTKSLPISVQAKLKSVVKSSVSNFDLYFRFTIPLRENCDFIDIRLKFTIPDDFFDILKKTR